MAIAARHIYECIAGCPALEKPVKLSAVTTCAALYIALTFAAAPARADTCDNIMAAFKAHMDELLKREAKGGALCLGMGEVIGLTSAARITASECGRADAAKEMDETVKAVREGAPAECK